MWAKLRDANEDVRVLRSLCDGLKSQRNKLLEECEALRKKIDYLETHNKQFKAERDNLMIDCENYQKRVDKANERYNKVLSILEDTTARKTVKDYSGLADHFKNRISLDQSKDSVMEASSVLALIPNTEDLGERAAYTHTVANCLYEYSELLKTITPLIA